MSKPNLILYHFEGCPFCQKVRNYLSQQSITIPMKDIKLDPQARHELLEVGGKTQVPCLFIDGKPMYESGDIIEWFKTSW